MKDFIYSISWEDLKPDKKTLKLDETDSVLTITGGGDNAFELLLNSDNVTCVDTNDAQTHLMELKMKSIQYGSYETIWEMFGEGKFTEFEKHIDTVQLSNKAYHYWATNSNYFMRYFYYHGSIGKMVKLLCSLRLNKAFTSHMFMNEFFVRFFQFCMYIFCTISSFSNVLLWNMCGVPQAQYNMITKHDKRSLYDYIWNHTLKPVITKTDIIHDNHFYYLLLNGKFTKQNCPDYLKENNYEKLKDKLIQKKMLNVNSTFIEVLKSNHFDKVIMMDHIDWNDHKYVSNLCVALKQSLNKDGIAIFKSASIRPWYVSVFHKHGFSLKRVGSHITDELYDRVNMYASVWSVEHTK